MMFREQLPRPTATPQQNNQSDSSASYESRYSPFANTSESTQNHSNMDYGNYLPSQPRSFYPERQLSQPQHVYGSPQPQPQHQSLPLPSTSSAMPGSIPSISQIPSQQHHALPILSQSQQGYRGSRAASLQEYRDPTANYVASTYHASASSSSNSPTGQNGQNVQNGSMATAPVGAPSFQRVNGSPREGLHMTLNYEPHVPGLHSTPRTHQPMGGDVGSLYLHRAASGGAMDMESIRSSMSAGAANSHANGRGAPSVQLNSRVHVSPELLAEILSPVDHVILSSSATEEEQYLHYLKEEWSNSRGKGMWDSITENFSRRFSNKRTPACLQMRYTRLFRTRALWPKEEMECLLEAWREDERHRFARITALMKEKGGGKAYDWKVADVEMALIRLQLEEKEQDEQTKIRRRKQRNRRTSDHPNITGAAAATIAANQRQHHLGEMPMIMTGPSWASPQNPNHPGTYAANGYVYDDEDYNEINDQIDRKYPSSSLSPTTEEADDNRMATTTGPYSSGTVVTSADSIM